jgi:hypothetical protein
MTAVGQAAVGRIGMVGVFDRPLPELGISVDDFATC